MINKMNYIAKVYINKLSDIIIYILNIRKVKAVLVDTPTHGNLGDHAIALAEQQLLDRLKIEYLELTANMIGGLEKIYAFFTPKDKMILVTGGGFLGDIWPNEEYRFRNILNAFKKNKIVVFPQTLTFDLNSESGSRFFDESKEIYTAHKNLVLFTREWKSYNLLKELMPDLNAGIVPDIVLSMESFKTDVERAGILFCLRADKEKLLSEKDTDFLYTIIKSYYQDEEISYTDTELTNSVSISMRKEEVNKKLLEFSTAKLVITDRLHGMIFATITNTPCIAMGNINGKVKRVYRWIENNDYVKYVDNINDVEEILSSLDIEKNYQYCKLSLDKEFFRLIKVLFNN